jgi:AbrB family looped-hinge helix DNA binding protein
MEVAKVTSKGQITIPRDIRVKLDLKTGDKILFFEEDGKYVLQNAASIALKNFQTITKGEPSPAVPNPDDAIKHIKSRKKRSR